MNRQIAIVALVVREEASDETEKKRLSPWLCRSRERGKSANGRELTRGRGEERRDAGGEVALAGANFLNAPLPSTEVVAVVVVVVPCEPANQPRFLAHFAVATRPVTLFFLVVVSSSSSHADGPHRTTCARHSTRDAPPSSARTRLREISRSTTAVVVVRGRRGGGRPTATTVVIVVIIIGMCQNAERIGPRASSQSTARPLESKAARSTTRGMILPRPFFSARFLIFSGVSDAGGIRV